MDGDRVYLPKISVKGYDVRPSSWGFTGSTMAIFLLLLVAAGLVGSFYLNQASHLAAAGLEVTRLTRERERLRQDNARLRRQIAELETLSNVKQRAERLGFVEAEAVEYVAMEVHTWQPSESDLAGTAVAEQIERHESESPVSQLGLWWQEMLAELEAWMKPER